MAIKQISVFIENKEGKLSDVVKLVSEADIDIRALSIADTSDFGILRMIVSDTDKAKEVICSDFVVKDNDVIAVKMDDKQGALYNILKCLEENKINLEYTYAFTAHEAGAYVVFRVDDVVSAESALSKEGFLLMTEEDIKNI